MNIPQYTRGRPVKPVVIGPRSLADMIRKHIFDHNTTLQALSDAWGLPRTTVATMLSKKRSRAIPVKHINATIKYFQLDDFDATALHRQAAREAGYKIDGPVLGNK